MATDSNNDYVSKIRAVKNNPALVIETIMDGASDSLDGNGYNIPDPTNPFVFLLESGVVNYTAAMEEQEGVLRRLYPRMAVSEDELYLHMSDKDYVNRFASPAETTAQFIIGLDELKGKAVATEVGDIRKITIPRFTSLEVNGMRFSLQYPIDLKVMPHGGITITWDTTVTSPLFDLTTNLLDWDIFVMETQKYIRLNVPMKQFKIDTYTHPLNQAAGFKETYDFKDQFYYARAFIQRGDGVWKEVKTTHTDQVYNQAELTVCLRKSSDNKLECKIPEVYFMANSNINTVIRIDIYTTKGPLNVDLSEYPASEFKLKYQGLNDKSKYYAPIEKFSAWMARSEERVVGGQNEESFLNLREKVITHSVGPNVIPISHPQLNARLDNMGFDIVTDIDEITNRQFIASRRMPLPTSGILKSPIGTTMSRVQFTIDELTRYNGVVDNGEQITITPDTLFTIDNGVVSLVNNNTLAQIMETDVDGKARIINNRQFVYSPFYYVLDTSDNSFDVRVYSLDDPKINYRSAVGTNETAKFSAAVQDWWIERVDNGWRLLVTINGDKEFQALEPSDIIVQVGYQPKESYNFASCNARFLKQDTDHTLAYEAIIETDFSVDEDDQVTTTNMSMFEINQTNFAISLDTAFDVTIIAANQDMADYERRDIDDMIQTHLIDTFTDVTAITRDRIYVTLGNALNNLWHRHRTVVTSKEYQTYDEDVPYVFEDTIYERDDRGDLVVEEDDDGNGHFVVKHEKGDPMLDEEGEPVIRFKKGTVVRDSNNEPIVEDLRGLLREWVIFLVDGTLYFVTDEEAVNYREELPSTIVTWGEQLRQLEGNLLEQSELFLYPTNTHGYTDVLIEDNRTMSLPINQSFTVNYYVSDSTFRNTEFRDTLTRDTIRAIADCLQNDLVSRSTITSTLMSLAGDGIMSVDVHGLGGSMDLPVVEMQNSSVRLAIGKEVVVKNNQDLSIADAVEVNYIRMSDVRQLRYAGTYTQ